MYCNSCGKSIANDSKFCSNCGKAAEQSSAEKKEVESNRTMPRYFFVAKSPSSGFVGQLTDAELLRRFRVGELPRDYVVTESTGPSYNQLLKKSKVNWVSISELAEKLGDELQEISSLPSVALRQDSQPPKSKQASDLKRVIEVLLTIAVVVYLLNGYKIINISSLFKDASNLLSFGSSSGPVTFNTSDESIQSNGNIAVAVQKIQGSIPSSTWEDAITVSSSQLSKDPFEYIGQIVKITGTVYSVRTVQLSQGNWLEALLLTHNSNSLAGVMSVDFLYNGSSNRIEPQTIITFAGYFAGIEQTKNLFGGDVEALAIVGNAIDGH